MTSLNSCPSCSGQLIPGIPICPYCSNFVCVAPRNMVSGVEPTPEQPAQDNMQMVAFILAATCLLLTISTTIALIFGSTVMVCVLSIVVFILSSLLVYLFDHLGKNALTISYFVNAFFSLSIFLSSLIILLR